MAAWETEADRALTRSIIFFALSETKGSAIRGMLSDAGDLGPALASPRGGGFEDDMVEALVSSCRRLADAGVVSNSRVTVEITDLDGADKD